MASVLYSSSSAPFVSILVRNNSSPHTFPSYSSSSNISRKPIKSNKLDECYEELIDDLDILSSTLDELLRYDENGVKAHREQLHLIEQYSNAKKEFLALNKVCQQLECGRLSKSITLLSDALHSRLCDLRKTILSPASSCNKDVSVPQSKRMKLAADSAPMVNPGCSVSSDREDESAEHLRSVGKDILQSGQQVQHASFASIAGLENVKNELYEAVVLPHLYPELFTGKIRCPISSILLCGLPGTGKTLLARAIAGELMKLCSNVTFLCVTPSNLLSKWIGDSEKSMKAVFEIAQKNKPCIVFFDEIDSLAPKRENVDHNACRVLTELLLQMNKLPSQNAMVMIAATNRPEALDSAVTRRFQKKIEVPLPNLQERKNLLELFLTGIENTLSADEKNQICEGMKGRSGSDFECLCREAAAAPFEDAMKVLSSKKNVDTTFKPRPVTFADFSTALKTATKPVKIETDATS